MKKKLQATILLLVISYLGIFGTPLLTITSSQIGTNYRSGDTYTFSGFATHTSAGIIRKSSFRWKVNYKHDDHWHDNYDFLNEDSLFSFTVPVFNLDPSLDVFFDIQAFVTVLGINGIEEKMEQVNIYPQTSIVTVTSSPVGIKFDLARGSIYTTPAVFGGTVNSKFPMFNYLDIQTINGVAYKFKNWSNCTTVPTNMLTVEEFNQKISIIYEPLINYTSGLSTNCLTTLETETENLDLQIFPNPVDEILFVDKRCEEIMLFAINGKKITFQEVKTFENTELRLKNLPQGVYVLKLKINNKFIFKQLVKL